MSTMFLRFVLIVLILQITSSKKECKCYFTLHNVGTEGCHRVMLPEQEICIVRCTEYCEKDAEIRIRLFCLLNVLFA